MQKFRSSDNSFDYEECRRQECRSVDNSFDYEKQKESASSASSASEKLEEEDTMQAALSSELLSEASLLHSCTPKRNSPTHNKKNK